MFSPASPRALADHVINGQAKAKWLEVGHSALACCLSMILPENWNPFFGIML